MGHDHHHDIHSKQSLSRIKFAFFLNIVFAGIEIIGGLFTNSVAILSDALHDLGDAVALGTAWYFEKVSHKKRDRNYSYGYKRFSMLGAVINGIVLLAGSIIILFETIPRLQNPEAVNSGGMMIMAILGIVFNGIAVWRLQGGESANERMVMLHLLEDVLGWVAVLIGSVIIYFKNWPIIDPILSLGITLYILINVFRHLRRSFKILLQGIPEHIDLKEIREKILKIEQVDNLHDLHIWTMDGAYHVMTLHIVVKNQHADLQQLAVIKSNIKAILLDNKIQHVTVEMETEEEYCAEQDC